MSGGVLKIGNHVIDHWSVSQGVVALSSGESELYALVKGVVEALHLKHMLCDLDMGYNMNVILLSDSSAARGMLKRLGAGTKGKAYSYELPFLTESSKGRYS